MPRRPTVVGSAGEQLVAATVLMALDGWPAGSCLELFPVDRGTDLGFDFIIRISGQAVGARISISIGMQVKATSRERAIPPLGEAKRQRLVEFVGGFAGPTLLVRANLEEDVVRVNDYREWLLAPRTRPIEVGRHDTEGIREAVRSICCDHLASDRSVERYLAHDDVVEARRTVAALDFLCSDSLPLPDRLQLLRNRVLQRAARHEPGSYRHLQVELDTWKPAHEKCGDHYDGYCIHYQRAVLRDEATRAQPWLPRGYSSRRAQLETAWGEVLGTLSVHPAPCKSRLTRLAGGLLCLAIVNGALSAPKDSSKLRAQWQERWLQLRRLLRQQPREQEGELARLLELYGAFIGAVTGPRPSPTRVQRLLPKLGYDDPDVHVAAHLFLAVLNLLAHDARAAVECAERGKAIARTIKNDSWLNPILLTLSVARRRLASSRQTVLIQAR